jgi:hypothetical protein
MSAAVDTDYEDLSSGQFDPFHLGVKRCGGLNGFQPRMVCKVHVIHKFYNALPVRFST